MISDITRVPKLMRYITWGDESFASPHCEDRVSDDGFQFAGEDKKRFVLARMCMTGHAFSRRDPQIKKAVCSSSIFAREKDGTKCDIEIITSRFRLIFNCGGATKEPLNVIHNNSFSCCNAELSIHCSNFTASKTWWRSMEAVWGTKAVARRSHPELGSVRRNH